MPCIAELAAWPRRATDLPTIPRSPAVLLGDPGDFQVAEDHNAHMRDAAGALQQVDSGLARAQWEALRAAYLAIGQEVHVLPAEGGSPDLCFTANPSLVLPLPGQPAEAWLAHMRHTSRRPEVAAHEKFHRARGLRIRELAPEVGSWEGCGDGVLHPTRFLMHAGLGPRSTAAAWTAFADAHPELDVLCYRLVDPRFYHLDTALAPLDQDRALYVPEAFDAAGLELLRAAFPAAIPLPLADSLQFAGNAHCPDGRHVLLDRACTATIALLKAEGFVPVPLDTSEFRKSGGSVFCLKLAL